MKTASLVFGIIVLVVMLVGFVPCFGSLNWINIPLAGVGLIISVVALVQSKSGEDKGKVIAGLVLCTIALIFGLIRLLMGGGIV
jgi:hypothetical protein